MDESSSFPMCPKHHQKFRNFCKTKTCMIPLCPDCIDEHNQYHTAASIKGDVILNLNKIISLKLMANRSHVILKDLISELAKDAEQTIGYLTLKRTQVAQSYEKNLITLRDVRVMIENLIKKFFLDLEVKLKAIMHNLNDMLNKPSENIAIIEQIRALNDRIDNPNTIIESITEAYFMDTDKIVDTSRKETKKHTLTIQQFLLPLFVDEALSQSIVGVLDKSVQLGRYPTKSNEIDPVQSSSRGFIKAKTADLQSSMQSYKMSLLRQDQESPIRKPTIQRQFSTTKYLSDMIQISFPNTFSPYTNHLNLHYFESQSKKLFLLPLDKPGAGFVKKELDIRFLIPEGHQSISTPQGHIFIFGGNIPNSPLKSQKIYRYNFDEEILEYMAGMIDGRANMSLCYSNGLIYIIGGVVSSDKITSKCETYNVATRQVEAIEPCFEASSFSGVCPYGPDLIYKFGGLLQGKIVSNTIQKYDKLAEKWKIVQPILSKSIDSIHLLSHTTAVQINKQEILIMGGRGQNLSASSQCITFNAQYEAIQTVDKFPVPLGEGFNSGSACVYQNTVYALLNAYKKASVPNYKLIIIFDGYKWRTLS